MRKESKKQALARNLREAVSAYWADGGPGKGSQRYWARVDELRTVFGDEAVESSLALMLVRSMIGCETVEARRQKILARRAKFAARAEDAPCSMCAAHYGDGGVCDEGKPMASPHRATEGGGQ